MINYDKPLLAKQLFKLINFEILRQRVKFKQKIHAGAVRGSTRFEKLLYHFRSPIYIIVI